MEITGQRRSRQMRSPFLALLLAHGAERGVDVAAIMRKLGLRHDPNAWPSLAISLAQLDAIAAEVADALGDPDLGLSMAIARPPGSYGVVEYAARTAASCEAALVRLARYQRLVNDVVAFEVTTTAETLVFEHRVDGEREGTGPHGNVFALATVLELLRRLMGAPMTPIEVALAHARPSACARLESYFAPAPIHFDVGVNRLTWPRALVAAPLPSADPALSAILEEHAQLLLRRLPPRDDLVARAREVLQRALSSGAPSLAAVARSLGVSSRTLQRRLREHGSTFQAVVDETRRALAAEHLERGASVAEVTFLLGYSEERAFTRAFRRWYATTPGRYRASRSA